jgi:hypothetical protein
MSDELIHLISLWAMKRGIVNNSTPLAQFAKLVSEIGELGDNIAKERDVTHNERHYPRGMPGGSVQ